jgi:hypothetical protein
VITGGVDRTLKVAKINIFVGHVEIPGMVIRNLISTSALDMVAHHPNTQFVTNFEFVEDLSTVGQQCGQFRHNIEATGVHTVTEIDSYVSIVQSFAESRIQVDNFVWTLSSLGSIPPRLHIHSVHPVINDQYVLHHQQWLGFCSK